MKFVKLKAEKLLDLEKVKLERLKRDNMVSTLGRSIIDMKAQIRVTQVAGEDKERLVTVKRIFDKAKEMKAHAGEDLRFALKCLNDDQMEK